MVNFSVNLTSLKDAQANGKTLFLSVPVLVHLEQIGISIDRLSKEDSSHQCG